MAKIECLNIKGEKVKDITLNDSIWNIEINNVVLKKAVDLYRASLRQGTHKTKTVAEVAGSGKKPWRQKGTGRARVGQKRNPIWRGGGHTFALQNRDYSFKMNKKEKSLALKSALSSKLKEKELIVIDKIGFETLKTKEMKTFLDNLKLNGKVMIVTKEDNENLYMASRNLNNIYVLLANEINVYDILNANKLICDEEAVNYIEEVLK